MKFRIVRTYRKVHSQEASPSFLTPPCIHLIIQLVVQPCNRIHGCSANVEIPSNDAMKKFAIDLKHCRDLMYVPYPKKNKEVSIFILTAMQLTLISPDPKCLLITFCFS